MRKFWKNRVLVVLLLLVTFSTAVLSACSSSNEALPSQTGGAETTSDPSASETPAEPPVEISMSTPVFEKSFPAGFQDDPVAKEIEKRLNIKLKIIPANAVGDVNAKFAAEMASGDLPDIAWVPAGDIMPKIISAKAAYPMDELLEQYGQDILKEIPGRIDFSRKFLSADVDGNSDGKMYFLSLSGDMDVDPIAVNVAPYLRYDLWKQLGYPKLETMNDYLPVLKQMMELEPTNANGDKNYGVSAWFGDGAGWNQWVLDFPFAYMNGVAQGMVTDMDMVTYEVKERIADPNSSFWQGVDWYNAAYRMGVLDPDSFTMKWDDYLTKEAANRIFMGWAPWQTDGGNKTFTANGETDKGYFQMPPPTQLDKYIVAMNQSLGGYRMFISANSKHPEKAMELLNFLVSYEGTELILNGVKGVHWDEADGKAVMKPEVLTALKDDPEYKIKSGIYKYHNIAGRGNSVNNPAYNTPIYLMYLPEVVKERLTPLQKEGSEYFKVELPSDLYMKTKTHIYYDTSVDQTFPPLPEELNDIHNRIYDYILTNKIKLIMQKDEQKYQAEKQKFIDDVQKLGGDQLMEWYRAELPNVLKNAGK